MSVTVQEYARRIAEHPDLQLPIPTTRTIISALVCVRRAECRAADAWRGASYNLLNTKRWPQGATGIATFNSAGVLNYASLEQGVWAHVLTLKQPAYGYPELLHQMRIGAPVIDIIADWSESQWGTFHNEDGTLWSRAKLEDFRDWTYRLWGREAYAMVRSA